MQSAQRNVTLSQTTVGMKALMAVSGLALFGFLVGHLLGNLKLYAGPQALNDYAAFLHSIPALLWTARIGLLAAIGAHIYAAYKLALRKSDARPVPYKKKEHLVTNYAARTMYWSGPILLFFIVYHLAHLTFGRTPGYVFDPQNVYNNVVYGFQNIWVSAIYIVGNLAVGFHLYHGLWSMFQTLGASHPRYDRWSKRFAVIFSLALTAGNLSLPISVLAGWVEPADADYPAEDLEA